MAPRFRYAGPDDAGAVARLHADSWRRHYRGVYSDAYLDGDVLGDRLAVWAGRLAAPAGTRTVLAEDGGSGDVLGFVHVVLDDDPEWGSLVDNLHVTAARQRTGVGRALLARAAAEAVAHATSAALHLWVLESNTSAQAFYAAMGGVHTQTLPVGPPGGDPARLTGTPAKFRISWPRASACAAG
ncbi:GNAT family N-acetyltransferase [Streptomyces sp. NPDC020983]|uniref:GNAT family N-acetyltransferase n=1 Tax=Streptomyces sp. NPDC020983 TaxID=3365106 RepID=UPI003791910D